MLTSFDVCCYPVGTVFCKLVSMSAPTDTPDRWEQWLVHLLWAVSTRSSALAEVALADSPLTLPGLGLLENIDARPGITIAGITRRTPQTQQTVSQIAARLDKLGFIERKLMPGSRAIGLYLTPAGARARKSAHDAVEAVEGTLLTELGERPHQRLVTLLQEVEHLIGGLRPDARPHA